jgi:hypothetical protein
VEEEDRVRLRLAADVGHDEVAVDGDPVGGQAASLRVEAAATPARNACVAVST